MIPFKFPIKFPGPLPLPQGLKNFYAILSKKRRGLTYKFVLFAIWSAVVPALIIALSLILIERRSLKEAIYREQSQTAQRIADRVWLHMDHIRSVMTIAAMEPGLASFPRARQEESLRLLLRWQPAFKEAFLLNPQGHEISKLIFEDQNFRSSDVLISHKNRPEFVNAIYEKRTVISPPFFSKDQVPSVFASCPTYGKRAILVARVTLENLLAVLREVRTGGPGIIYLADGQGNLLAHPDFTLVQQRGKIPNADIAKAFQQGLRSRKSYGIYRDQTGKKVVGLIQPILGSDWVVVMEVPVKFAYASLWSMQKEVFKWTVLCALIILVLGLWRVRQILKPLRVLQEGAESIAAGNLNLNLSVHTGDELEQLARSFEQMANSLRDLETLRHDLISMLVHDLKNPLSAIMGGLDYMTSMMTKELTDPQKKVLTITKKSADDLHGMIQNLLDVAKMEEGKLELSCKMVEVQPLLKDCVDSFRIQSKKESKVLTVDSDVVVQTFFMDELLMRRVVTNLVANAVRHTPSGGRIHVYTLLKDKFLRIVVEDNGEGIPKEYQDKIFSKFVQAQRKRAHLRTGTGLGLTFCKMVVELHRGKISVESQVGKGSAFIVDLPMKAK